MICNTSYFPLLQIFTIFSVNNIYWLFISLYLTINNLFKQTKKIGWAFFQHTTLVYVLSCNLRNSIFEMNIFVHIDFPHFHRALCFGKKTRICNMYFWVQISNVHIKTNSLKQILNNIYCNDLLSSGLKWFRDKESVIVG